MTSLLTTREVGELLGVHPETVLKWARAGDLPSIVLPSGAIRYHPDHINGWLKQRERATSRDKECQPPSRTSPADGRVHSISSTAAHEIRE
jgi:excisionase family DNA binding protein